MRAFVSFPHALPQMRSDEKKSVNETADWFGLQAQALRARRALQLQTNAIPSFATTKSQFAPHVV